MENDPRIAPGANEAALQKIPRFHGSGRDIGTSNDRSPSARARLRDAFTPSRPVQDPRMFAGRTETLRTLIRAIEDMRLHVVVYGERGIGKTSLLHLLTQLAREAHHHVAYHSCGERDTFSDVFRSIADEIPLLYDARYDPAADETASGASLASRLPAGEFSVSQVSEVFAHLSNTRLIVILDEFDRSPPGEFRRSIAEFIKNVSDRSLRVQLVIAGVASNLPDLVEHIPSIRRNILGLQVPPMNAQEVGEVVGIGQRISGLPYSKSAVEQIVRLSNGSPYLASLLAQYAGFHAVETNAKEVTAREVRDVTAQIGSELRNRLPERVVESVDKALADGLRPVLLAFATTAMQSMGRIILPEEQAAEGHPSQELLGYLERYPGLIEPVPNEPAGRYQFAEEGLPVYLWISLSDRTA
jgi:phosphoribosylcarboxyaminoimidazole (NCAIR) mutase